LLGRKVATGVDAELEHMPEEPSYGEMLALAQRHFHAEQAEAAEAAVAGARPELGDDAPGKGGAATAAKKAGAAKPATTQKAMKPVVTNNKFPPTISVLYQGRALKVKDGDTIPRLSQISITAHSGKPAAAARLYYTSDGNEVRRPSTPLPPSLTVTPLWMLRVSLSRFSERHPNDYPLAL